MNEASASQADRLAARARRLESKDPKRAIELQREAITGYRATLDDASKAAAAGLDRAEIAPAAHRVSEALGRLGGLLRRNGDLDQAIEEYEKGKHLEHTHELADSYCLGNWVALRWLRGTDDETALATDTNKARALVERQVEGERRNQWWAWADLGMLSLLAGRADEATRAYDRFADHGARRTDYDSTMDVLVELRTGLADTHPSVSQGIGNALDQLGAQRAQL